MSDWDAVTEARIPVADLVCLAPLRTRSDIRVRMAHGIAWLNWTTSRAEAIRELLPRVGAEFFTTVKGQRYRLGSRLPSGEAPPDGEARPLATVLMPSPATLAEPDAGIFGGVDLRLVRCDVPRPTVALVCPLEALREFADRATTAELAGVSGLLSRDRAVLFGETLPSVPGAVRFHGKGVLIPIGFKLHPELPETIVRSAAGIADDDVLLITGAGIETIPRSRAEPLTRAGLRLAIAGATP